MDENQIKTKMSSAIRALQDDVSAMRTGRASASMVENIVIPAYGGAQRLKIMELGSINATDPSMIVIDPWDKSIIGDIRKGIMSANVGLNPSIDGEVIRIAIAPMTGEERQKHVKMLQAKLENARIHIRQIRGDEMKDIKTSFESKEISEDDKKQFETNVQKITDDFIAQVDEIGQAKEKELLQV